MNFFRKIYFTTMFIAVVSVAVSGYILIESGFRAQLDGESDACMDYNDIVFSALSNELGSVETENPSENYDEIKNTVVKVVRSISIDGNGQRNRFDIIDADRQIIFSSINRDSYAYVSTDFLSDISMIRAGSDTETALFYYDVKADGERFYIRTVRPTSYRGAVFYINTYRDCTHVFDMQRSQLNMLALVMICMLFTAGALTFVISKLLLRRVVNLTKITQTIAGGDLTVRAERKGQDEIAVLSRNFNVMADRLVEKMNELQSEVERRELFVGAFAHEIKTPLTSVIGYADYLRKRPLSDDARRLSADYIFYEGKRLETLSMRLLELIVMKKRELLRSPVDVYDTLSDVITMFKASLSDTGITVEFDAAHASVLMEEELMKTVFYNLLDNARKSFDDGGVIRVLGHIDGDDYLVTVSDTGRGMERGELSKITDAFYMIDKSRSRSQGGAGLGLSICSEIINRHGFGIAFESEVGKGTTVTVSMDIYKGGTEQ